jgi:hypothetical protein
VVPADQAAGEGEEGFVHVGVAVVADGEAAVAVEPGEGAFDDPAVGAESGAVLALAAGDERFDAAFAQLAAAAGVVVAAVT